MSYGGSYFHMHREGDYEEYKSHRISKEQEKEWIEEYRSQMLTAFEQDPQNANSVLDYCATIKLPDEIQQIESIAKIVEKNKKMMDSFTKLLCAEQFVQFFEENHRLRKKMKSVVRLVERLLTDVINNPTFIASGYRKMGYLSDVLHKDVILDRVQRCQQRLTKWTTVLGLSMKNILMSRV